MHRPFPLVVLFVVLANVSWAAADDTGTIIGTIVDEQGIRRINTGHAVVCLCDAATGGPILRESKEPLDVPGLLTDFLAPDSHRQRMEFWYAVTVGCGEFRFDLVPPGTYRLVAQSWSGTDGLPERRNTSEIVFLHGTGEDIVVRADEVTHARIKPLGSKQLSIKANSPTAAYLFISRKALHADPILGFLGWGWGTEFTRNIVGATHLANGHATFIGVPDDCDIHVSLFGYDPPAASGGGTFHVGEVTVAEVDMIGSGGESEIPEKLRPIVEYLAAHHEPLAAIMGLAEPESYLDDGSSSAQRKLMRAVQDVGNRTVKLGEIGDVRVIDVLAADAYRHRKQLAK